MRFFRFIRFIENMLYPVRWARSWLGRLFRFGGGKGFSLSLAAKVALTTFILFFLLWLFFFISNWSTPGSEWSPSQFLFGIDDPEFWIDQTVFFLLVVLLTIFVYWSVRLAVLESVSLYPEIDRCWDAITKWKDDRNYGWNEFNRYLVLGTNFNTATNMHADNPGGGQDEHLIPVGSEEWVHAYGSKQEMFIHLNKICNLSCYLEKNTASGVRIQDQHYHGTIEADQPFGESLDVRKDDYGMQDGGYGATQVADGPGNFNTIDPSDSSSWNPDLHDQSGEMPPAAEEDDKPTQYFDDDDSPDDRLLYFCEYIRDHTDTELPFNGILVAIPFDSFNEDNYRGITSQVRKDLISIRKNAGVNYPVTFLFTSMENDSGFPKLQHLLGLERAKGRFGAGCKVQNTPSLTQDNFDKQVARSCTTFEKWVYDRWSRNSQLTRAEQNKALYKMLIRIRQGFKHRLEHLLNHSLLWKDSELPEGESNDIVLAGCYFASTGSSPGSRAFLPGLFAKCSEFATLSGWGDAPLYKNRIFSVLASAIFAFSIILILVVVLSRFSFFN